MNRTYLRFYLKIVFRKLDRLDARTNTKEICDFFNPIIFEVEFTSSFA